MITLKLTKTQVLILHTLLNMDGASDYVGKTLEGDEWEDVFETLDDVRKQANRQGMDLE